MDEAFAGGIRSLGLPSSIGASGKFLNSPSRFCIQSATMNDASANNSPVVPTDIGFFLAPGIDGCEITARVVSLLLQKFPNRDRWCVEFGAGNDSHGSTTHRLIAGDNYSAVLIEGDKDKYPYLCSLYKENKQVTLLQKFVSFRAGDDDCLDNILSRTPIAADFDFVSIDIDGNDYHVWNAVTRYRPKLVMIEFNPTIPPEIKYVQPADPAVKFGNSLAALVELGKSKGYELVWVLGVNAWFVRREDYHLFGIQDNSIYALWTKRDCVTYLFSGYDGRIFLAGCQKLPWTFEIPIKETKMQVIPRFLQKYPFKRNHYRLFELLTSPGALARKFIRRFLRA
jgi:hypothetical protein